MFVAERLVQADSQYYMLLREVAQSLSLDHDEYYIDADTSDRGMRFIHLHSALDMTCFWTVLGDNRIYLIPKY